MISCLGVAAFFGVNAADDVLVEHLGGGGFFGSARLSTDNR